MAQNGRVPVFASDDRNVTAAALSTLGGNLVWSEKLAPSPAELLAAVGRGWAGWPVGLAEVSLCLHTFLPVSLPLSTLRKLCRLLPSRVAQGSESFQNLVSVWLREMAVEVGSSYLFLPILF